jgi:hypothetical protein
MKEKDIQKLVADFPWLLSVNYESVPELANKGMEVALDGDIRIDLLLREKITNRPVVVEFKANPFYRENIGQILEYRARIISEFQSDDSVLYKLFGPLLASPIMILVVPKCDERARIACNMSAINLYEYESPIAKWIVPEKRSTLEEFGKILDKSDMPLTEDRYETVDKIEDDILNLLSSLKAEDEFIKHRSSRDIYYFPLGHCFLNKWLFPDNKASIGIYEDLVHRKYNAISIEFYSKDAAALSPIQKELSKIGKKAKLVSEKRWGEYYLTYEVAKSAFIKDVKGILLPYIKSYLKVHDHKEL